MTTKKLNFIFKSGKTLSPNLDLVDGLSDYDLWLSLGNTGTEEDYYRFLANKKDRRVWKPFAIQLGVNYFNTTDSAENYVVRVVSTKDIANSSDATVKATINSPNASPVILQDSLYGEIAGIGLPTSVLFNLIIPIGGSFIVESVYPTVTTEAFVYTYEE